MDKTLNDIAYDLAKETFKNTSFTFDNLWQELSKSKKIHYLNDSEIKGRLYSEIMQDIRFLYVGNQTWKLRQFVTSEEIKNAHQALYDFDNTSSEETQKVENENEIEFDYDPDNAGVYDDKTDPSNNLDGFGEEETNDDEN